MEGVWFRVRVYGSGFQVDGILVGGLGFEMWRLGFRVKG